MLRLSRKCIGKVVYNMEAIFIFPYGAWYILLFSSHTTSVESVAWDLLSSLSVDWAFLRDFLMIDGHTVLYIVVASSTLIITSVQYVYRHIEKYDSWFVREIVTGVRLYHLNTKTCIKQIRRTEWNNIYQQEYFWRTSSLFIMPQLYAMMYFTA